MGEDDDPQALLATFDKCRRRADGTVDTNTLVHWLCLEVDAPQFVKRLESLGKTNYTRAEFEHLLLNGVVKGSSDGSRTSPESRGMDNHTFHTSAGRKKKKEARKQRPSSQGRERLVEEEVESPHAKEQPPSNEINKTSTESNAKHNNHHHHHQGQGDIDSKTRKEMHITITPPRSLSASPERTFSTHYSFSPNRSRHQRVMKQGSSARLVRRQQQQQHASSKWSVDQEQDEYPYHSSSGLSEYSSSSSGSSGSSEDEKGANAGYRHHRHDYFHRHHRKPSSNTSRRRNARSKHWSPGPSPNISHFLSPLLTEGIRDFFRLGVGNARSGTHSSSSSRNTRRGNRRGAAGRDQESDVEAAQDGRTKATVISRKDHGSWTEALAQSRLLNGKKGKRNGGGPGSSSSHKTNRRGHSRSHWHRDHRSTSPPPHPSSTGNYVSHDQQQERQPVSSIHHTSFGFPQTTTGTNPSRSSLSYRREQRINHREEEKPNGGFKPTITRSCTLTNPALDSGSPTAFDQSLPWDGKLVPRDSEAASLITGRTYWRRNKEDSDRQALQSRTVDPALRAVMDGLDHLSGTPRPQLQGLLLTAQDNAASALANKNQAQNRVLLEGNVELWLPSRFLGSLYKSWVPFHLVLYAGTKEIRLYQSSIPSAWGIIPLHEKGTLELRLLEKIECPTDPQWGGRRFDLVVRASSSAAVDAKYPGLGVYPGDEKRATHTARYNFRSQTAQNRLLWVSLITAVLDSCSAPPSSSSRERTLTLAPHDPAPISFSLPCRTSSDEVTLPSPPVSSTAAAMSTTSSAALARGGVGLGGSGDLLNSPSRTPLRATYSSLSATASRSLPSDNVKALATHHISSTSSPASPPRGGAGQAPVGGR